MTTIPPLIGLIGRQRAGKDTVAETLIEDLGYARVAFADPLRELALAIDPLVGPAPLPGDGVPRYRRLSEVVDAIGWEAAKDCVPEVRSTALQSLGQALRGVDASFWVDQAMRQVEGLRADRRLEGKWDDRPYPVVVTDVRMPNEAEAIRLAGGYLVRVTRSSAATTDAHITETALDDYPEDFVVENDGTLADLRQNVLELAATISPTR